MTSRVGAAIRGLLAGAGTGAATALLDLLYRGTEPAVAFGPSASLGVVLLYLVPWAILGSLVGLLTRRDDAAFVGTAGLGVLTLVGGIGNIRFLPSLLDPRSLLFDAILLALVAGLVAWALRRTWPARPLRIVATFLVVLGLGIGFGLRANAAADPADNTATRTSGPNLLVLLLDALRADHLGLYGYERDTSPHLDAFAVEAAVYTSAYAQSSWTKPSVATLFTGLYPESHDNHAIASRLPADLTTLPEILRDAGYRTGVFAENSFVSPLFGYDRGVGTMVANEPDVVAQSTFGHLVHQIVVRVPALMPVLDTLRLTNFLDPRQRFKREGGLDLPASFDAWLADGEGPFFGYVHLMKPHAPYICPEPFDGAFGAPADSPRGAVVDPPHVEGIAPFATAEPMSAADRQALVDNYDERILYGDHLVSRILESVERHASGDTAILVVADHGEEFGEHGLYDHGHSLQEGVVRVPFLLRYPARVPAGRVARPVRLLDVGPTLLDLAGLPAHDQFDGSSVLALPGEDFPRPVLAQVHHGADYGANALWRDGLKLVRSRMGDRAADRVFDLRTDPAEDHDLAQPGLPPLTDLSAELDLAITAAGRLRRDAGDVVLDAETTERLRALGYIQ